MIRVIVFLSLVMLLPLSNANAENAELKQFKRYPLIKEGSEYASAGFEGWAKDAIREIYTFSAENWQEKIEYGSRNFSKSGWGDVVEHFDKTKIFHMAETNDLIVNIEFSDTEIRKNQDVAALNNYEFPATILYQHANSDRVTEDNVVFHVQIESNQKKTSYFYPLISGFRIENVPSSGE